MPTARVFSRIMPQVARNGRNRRIIDARLKRVRRKLSVILATNASTYDFDMTDNFLREISLPTSRMCWKLITCQYSQHSVGAEVFYSSSF